VGACAFVLSCLALNDLAIRGPWLLGHLIGTREPRAWLSRAQARVEPGHMEELDRTDRW
jgi:hypothetical protein